MDCAFVIDGLIGAFVIDGLIGAFVISRFLDAYRNRHHTAMFYAIRSVRALNSVASGNRACMIVAVVGVTLPDVTAVVVVS